MANNPYVNKVIKADGTTIIDISDTTATASDVASGKYFYTAAGAKTQGTASGGSGTAIIEDTLDANGGTIRSITTTDEVTLTTKSITANGTYAASSDNVDGYSSVTVNVSGGGGDTWTWMGKNPTKISTLRNVKEYLEDTAYATWTPTTTQTTLVASSTFQGDPLSLNYDYLILLRFHSHYEYGAGATDTSLTNEYFYVSVAQLFAYPGNLVNMTTNTNSNAANLSTEMRHALFYKNSSGTDSYATTSSAVYPSWAGFSLVNTANQMITYQVYNPIIYAKCSNAYFSTTNAAAVDQSTSYYEYIMELWRVDSRTTYAGALVDIDRNMWLNGF